MKIRSTLGQQASVTFRDTISVKAQDDASRLARREEVSVRKWPSAVVRADRTPGEGNSI